MARTPRWGSLAALLSLVSGTLGAQSSPAVPGDTLERLLRTAEAHHFRGALPKAQATLARAEALARRGSDTSALARVWVARTDVWISQTTATNGGYTEADSGAALALRFAERSGDPRLIADATDLAGRVLYSRRINLGQGDYEQPLRHFQRALALRKAAADTGGIVASMFRVGLIHERKDESAQAIALYQQALRIAGEAYPLERSNLTRHLAYQRQGQGDLDQALDLFRQSLHLREQAGFELTRPSALTSIGDLYRRKGDYDRALEYGRRALGEAERLRASRFVVGALISLGQTHGAAGDRRTALEQLRHAERLADEIGYVGGATRAREEAHKLATGS